jgi:hypothetical protein
MARAATLLILITLIAACGPRFNWQGTWVGERPLGEIPPGVEPAAARTLSRIQVTIRDNNRFELIEAGVPIEGSVRFRGRDAVLSPELVLGRPLRESPGAENVHRDILLEPQPDGTVLYYDGSPLGPAGPIRLERAQPGAP